MQLIPDDNTTNTIDDITALENALGLLNSVVSNHFEPRENRVEAAAVLGDLILRYHENVMLFHDINLEIPVIQ